MPINEVHVGDIGTSILVTFKDENNAVVDISTATVKQIILKKPNETNVTKTAGFVTTGADGLIYYVTVNGDLDQAGIWQVQGYVEMGGGSWYSDINQFSVSRNL